MEDFTKKVLDVVEDIGIVEGHSNGARMRTIVFRVWDQERYGGLAPAGAQVPLFRIDIKDESCESQTYARLSRWTDAKGFQTIVMKQPKRDYGVDIAYKRDYSQDAFDAIIDDLVKMAYNITWG